MIRRSRLAGGLRRCALRCTWGFTAALSLAIGPAGADVIGKRPQVIDGNTLELAGVRLRLYGIDAPETEQTCRAEARTWNCGMEARWATINRIGQNWVACRARGRDPGGALAAVCYLGGIGGPELNSWLVAQGWALAYRPESQDYIGDEAAARQAGRGIWRGEFVAPWIWRQR